MNLKKNALFYSFSSYNGTFPESLLIVQISQICATTEENRIALYLFFKLIQAPTGSFPAGAFLFHRRYMNYLSEKSYTKMEKIASICKNVKKKCRINI